MRFFESMKENRFKIVFLFLYNTRIKNLEIYCIFFDIVVSALEQKPKINLYQFARVSAAHPASHSQLIAYCSGRTFTFLLSHLLAAIV